MIIPMQRETNNVIALVLFTMKIWRCPRYEVTVEEGGLPELDTC